jgi:hypothetical protein
MPLNSRNEGYNNVSMTWRTPARAISGSALGLGSGLGVALSSPGAGPGPGAGVGVGAKDDGWAASLEFVETVDANRAGWMVRRCRAAYWGMFTDLAGGSLRERQRRLEARPEHDLSSYRRADSKRDRSMT